MYSPKIKEDLIPIIYQKAKEVKTPMTKIVDIILREHLQRTASTSQVNPSKASYN